MLEHSWGGHITWGIPPNPHNPEGHRRSCERGGEQTQHAARVHGTGKVEEIGENSATVRLVPPYAQEEWEVSMEFL